MNKEETAAYNKAYRAKNREQLNAYDRLRNKEPNRASAMRAAVNAYRHTPIGSAVTSKQDAAYRSSKRGKATRANYQRARSAQVQPDSDHLDLINAIYELCPEGWHVDHIVPLSKSGLHVPTNLQYLTSEDNMKKGTSLNYIPTIPAIAWQDYVGSVIPTTKGTPNRG